MKSPNKFKHQLKRLYTNKTLKGVHYRPVLMIIFLVLVLLSVSGITYYIHEAKTNKQLNIAPVSNQDSSSSGCDITISGLKSTCAPQQSSTSNSSTSTQPAQTTTQSTPSTSTSPQSSTDSTTSDCTVKYLPPPPTTYEDTNLLPQGQTQQASQGGDGDEYICSGKPTRVYLGIAPVVWVGTGTSGSSTTSQGGSTSNNNGLSESEAAQQCDENLANGADASDPQAYLDQCMHQYGY